VWLANGLNTLIEDPPGSGVKTGLARGNLSSSSDVDFYQFSGIAGEQVTLAVEVPGAPNASGLGYQIQLADGTVLRSFGVDYTGWGQGAPITLPATGTYLIRISSGYDYEGEYHLRVTTVRPPMQMETESNDSIGQANALSFVFTNGHQKASVVGYLSLG